LVNEAAAATASGDWEAVELKEAATAAMAAEREVLEGEAMAALHPALQPARSRGYQFGATYRAT
jgi:hypothetical protein